MTRVLLILLTGCNVVAAQETTFSEDHIHGRSAYILENKLVRIGALRGAGHIAEIRLKSDDPRKSVNPMLVHHYQTTEELHLKKPMSTYHIEQHGQSDSFSIV